MSFPSPSQVTSRGCARAFILCVLWRGWEYVRNLKGNGEPVCFPFPESVVQEWIDAAIRDCTMAKEFVNMFGGTDFNLDDQSSYWTQPAHFYTWWKNNVERKSKFSSLARDAISKEDLVYDRLRTFYCQQAVAISANIRNHFDRIITHQRDFNIYQVTCPIDMPEHMKLPEISPVFVKRNMDTVVSQPLTYVHQTLETFIIQKFPSLKRFLKRRRQGDVYDSSHATALEAMKNNLSALSSPASASPSNNLAKRSCFSAFVRRGENDKKKMFLTKRSKFLSDEDENVEDKEVEEEEDDEDSPNNIDTRSNMCLRPRRTKRSRTYAFSLPTSAFGDSAEESYKGHRRWLLQDSDDNGEDMGEFNENEEDNELEEDDEDYLEDSSKKKKIFKFLSSPRKRHRPRHSVSQGNVSDRRYVAVKNVGEILYESVQVKQEAKTPSSKAALAAKPRRLKLPKSPLSKATSSHTSKIVTWEYDYTFSHSSSSDPHRVECQVPPRPLDLDDFQLFNNQEMLADAVLSPVTLEFDDEDNTDVYTSFAAPFSVNSNAIANAMTPDDMLSLHPLPWQLHASLVDSSSTQLISFFDRALDKMSFETMHYSPEKVTSIARFLETPESSSTRSSPSENLDRSYPGISGLSPAMTPAKKTVAVSCTTNDHFMMANQQPMESFLSISFDEL